MEIISTTISVEADSCLSGGGAVTGEEYYHCKYPSQITNSGLTICHPEMLNMVIAEKLWCHHWRRQNVVMYCDNSAAILTLQSGRARDPYLLMCARDIWYIKATYDFKIIPRHKPGANMTLADSLSRFHISESNRKTFEELTTGKEYKQLSVPYDYFYLKNDI